MIDTYTVFIKKRLFFLFVLAAFTQNVFAQQKLIHFWDFNDTYPYSDIGIGTTNTLSDSLGTADFLTPTGPGRGDTLYALPASYSTMKNKNPHIRYYRPAGLQGNAILRDSVVDNASGGSWYFDYSSRHYPYFTHSDSSHVGRNCYIKSLQPNLNSYFYLYMPTTGYHNINLNFALSGSGGNMAKYIVFSYSTDSGSTWKKLTHAMDTFNIGGISTPDTLQALNPITRSGRWYPVGINFSSDTTVSNNAEFILRFNFAMASASATDSIGASSSSGSVHFDNFSLLGDSVCPSFKSPQPSVIGICLDGNGSSSLTVLGGMRNTYQWQVNQGSGFSNVNNGGVYSGALTDTLMFTDVQASMNGYTYQCIVSSGSCNSNLSSVKPLTVHNPPAVQALASPDTVCAGTNLTLSENCLGCYYANYAWSGGAQNYQPFVPLSSGTYTVTATDGYGCMNTSSVGITVNTLPSVSAASNPDSVCPGAKVTLSDGGNAVSYSWSGGITNGVPFVPAGSGTYTVTGTALNGCTATSAVLVTVNPSPVVSANPASEAICAGSTVSLFGQGALSYAWTGGVKNEVPFSPPGSKTYTVTGTDSHGCTATSVTTVTVNPLPKISITASADSVCEDSSVTLSGRGASSYIWTGGIMDSVPFVPLTTQNYKVTGMDSNGCRGNASITITVNVTPQVTAGASMVPYCIGSTDTLKGGGARTYTWSGGERDRVGFVPLASNTYTVTGTDSHGCISTASITIAVDSLPLVFANATSTEICAGTSTVLFGSGAETYKWTGGPVDDQPYVLFKTGTFLVTGTDANGCKDTASIKILVDSTPPAYAGKYQKLCFPGKSVEIGGPGNSAYSYSWSPGANLGCSICAETLGLFTITTTDTLTVLNNLNGCMSTDTVTVFVDAQVRVRALSADSIVCLGSSTFLYGSGAKKYSWSAGILDSVEFIPTGTKAYAVTGTDGYGCTATSSIEIKVNQLPVVSAHTTENSVCNNVKITLTGLGARSYSWSGGAMNGIPFIPSATQTFTVTGMDSLGCSDTASITIDVNNCAGIAAYVNSSELKIYPNPGTGQFVILGLDKAVLIQIFSDAGRVVKEMKAGSAFVNVNIEEEADGIYFLRVINEDNSILLQQKVIKQE